MSAKKWVCPASRKKEPYIEVKMIDGLPCI